MNVRCPNCESAFRVDPERVPVSGIKARCSRCSTIFHLTRDGLVKSPTAATVPASAPPPPAPVAAPAAPSPPAPLQQVARPAAPAMPPIATPVAPAMPSRVAAPAPAPAAAAPAQPVVPRPIPTGPPPALATPAAPEIPVQPATATKRPSFRNQEPTARAQRLARALVSDIVAYNKDKVKETQGGVALRTEFRDEIRKSWEEYVEQVGLELAKSTPYFRDALNEILARGEKVF